MSTSSSERLSNCSDHDESYRTDDDNFKTDDDELDDDESELQDDAYDDDADDILTRESEDDEPIDDDDPRGLVGLQNLGNTCYMNGALQALSNCQQVTRFILDCPGYLKSNGLCRSYSDLIREIWDSKRAQYAVPTSIIRNIKCIYPAFRGCTQQDTQEFLRCFLEQLHDELKQPVRRDTGLGKKDKQHRLKSSLSLQSSLPSSTSLDQPSTSTSESTSASTTSDCNNSIKQDSSSKELEGGDHYRKTTAETNCAANSNQINHRSIISDTFEFKISSYVVCSSCNNISITKETFKDLSIPIPGRDHPYYQKSADDEEENAEALLSSHTTNEPSDKVETNIGHSDSNSSDQDSSNSKTKNKSDIATASSKIDKTNGEHNSEACKQIQQHKSLFQSIPIVGWFWSWLNQLSDWFWGPQVTLQDCLSIFFGTDPLEGDNEYSCELCTKKNRGVKYLKILELPEVLCIHFKRYESIGSAKITTHVSFPLSGLDLAPFMSETSRPQCTTYNLIACICHHGSALLTGHYTTYALNCYDDQWYEFDDQCVTNVQDYQVENSEAYILFYQKSTLDDRTERQRVKASKLLKKGLPSQDIRAYFVSKQWVNRFNTFVEPGPITNYDFLCVHKKVSQSRQAIVDRLCHPVNQAVWKYLKKIHGGGPVCRELTPCDICE